MKELPPELVQAILMLAWHHSDDHDELGAAAKIILEAFEWKQYENH
jgi:hypothetical protein